MVSKTLILAVLFLVASNVQALPAEGTASKFGTLAKRASGSPISSQSCLLPVSKPYTESYKDGTCCIRDADCRSGACITGPPTKKDKKRGIKAEIGICSCIPGFEDTDEGEGPEGACCKSSDDCANTCMDGVCRGD
ncbi:hypothetical protein BGX34_004598 [Mortierella sp. NVP85]|nr:hypothetical protein BGX34_004598 [Mortierella sp. NVP85]